MAFPPAEGVRISWATLPADVCTAVEGRLGARVVEAVTHQGGFSPGFAGRVRTADDQDHFLKAVSNSINPVSVELYRREARIAAGLPRSTPCPHFQWHLDNDEWVVLAFEFIRGTTPNLPWRSEDLDRVLRSMVDLSDVLTPSPIAVETASELWGDTLMRWRDLASRPEHLARVAPTWRAKLDELIALEARWPEMSRGDSLVHLDIRADNVLLSGDRVYFVDWPWAAIAAPWLDLVAFLPSVAMQGGPDPDTIWNRHPWSRTVDSEAVDAFLAAFAGMLTRQSLLPPQPGLPTVRAFQAAQGQTARAWLARRRRWTDAIHS